MRISSLCGRNGPRALHVHRLQCRLRLQHRALSSTTSLQSENDTHGLPALTKKWQPLWDKDAAAKGNSPRGSAYVLPMFPYPSGTLHLGHLRVYTISDVLARVKRMMGYDVLHPIGWDAFGLPAENAAIERGVHPADWTASNIEAMKSQMMAMGGQWDWDREFRTCDPDFYKHTQRLFLELYKKGLAYQAESMVNWDPVDQTVLANEQVDANGCSWRSGAKVEQKMLKQWFLRITKFRAPLVNDLKTLDEWPERVKAMQKNWIGLSQGTRIDFRIKKALPPDFKERSSARRRSLRKRNYFNFATGVSVFTTRADTLPGAQYVALSMKHFLVRAVLWKNEDRGLRTFIRKARNLPPDTKEGYLLEGIRAINPLASALGNGYQPDSLPVFVAPYVRDIYGTGAVMGVPGHDARDHAFWRQNKGQAPVKYVITPNGQGSNLPTDLPDEPLTKKGHLVPALPHLAGLSSDDAIQRITSLAKEKQFGKAMDSYRLKDWLISRQRYWGTPIPIVHCSSCGPVPVPDEELPVRLPNLPASSFEGRNGNPLEQDKKWKDTKCPKCKGPAHRETDTMDTFMDSSWYFFRFLDPQNSTQLFSPQLADSGMPVDTYVGGVEHAILHLLYARFITKFLAKTGRWPKGTQPSKGGLGEPFKRLVTQGMVHGKTYTDPTTGRFLRPDELDLSKETEPIIKETGLLAKVSYEKMSKSKYNGVDPGNVIKEYGADATRAHMLFQAPINDVLEWDETKITGVQRWLKRVMTLSNASWYPEYQASLLEFKPPGDLDNTLHWLEQLQSANMLTIPERMQYSVGSLSQQPITETQGHDESVEPFSESTTETHEQDESGEPETETHEEFFLKCLEPIDRDLLVKLHKTIASVTKSYTETYSLNTIVSDLMTLTNAIWTAPPHASQLSPVIRYMATLHLLRLAAPITPAVAEEGWHLLHSKFNGPVRDTPSHPLHAIRPDSGPSVFSFGFPAANHTIIDIADRTTTCIVQVNSRFRFKTEIRKFDHDRGGSNNNNNPGEEPTTTDASAATTEQVDDLQKREITHVLTQLARTDQGKLLFDHDHPKSIWNLAGKPWPWDLLRDGPREHSRFLPVGWKVFVVKKGEIVNFVKEKRDPKAM
ncbi:leucyl-tRNA synthetase [Periconia macrospinosa]|uniref:leucine--tRNA ligase n=1 Tax=Periconia macrospinosa TaxID=97972 RepID=A0A2V1E0G5_9PLEO|nr:leucyl-tRNA synthetase [Periconia macrospinosa]